jgi:hypothetical protein
MRGTMRRSVTVFVAAMLLLGAAGAATVSAKTHHATGKAKAHAVTATGKAQLAPASQTRGKLIYRGTVNLAAVAAQTGSATGPPGRSIPGRKGSPLPLKSAPRAAQPAPNPAPTQISSQPGPEFGFVGLTTVDSGSVNGFDVEPPDQGLCAHHGIVLEGVNLAVRVFTTSGIVLSPTVSLNDFFGLAPAVNTAHNPPTYGPFISDPKCYYDGQTGRWFFTALEIDVNPYTGALANRSSELIAVSQTSDPTGNYGLFSIDTTNDGQNGTPVEPNCPCFGDQPRIGADANGFYISTDSYPIHGSFNSNGGELYAMSKQGLATAAAGASPPPTVVAIHLGAVPIGGYPANAVQPATTPEGGAYAPDREHFLSTPDFNGFATSGGAGAAAVVLWTLSNTSTLANASPSLTLTDAILPSEPYVPPVNALQKPGPRPLGDASPSAPLPPLSVNDDRMQQVEYLHGQLFSSLNTGVGPSGTADRSGVAWFVVSPQTNGGVVSRQGYVAAPDKTTLLYPAIGLDSAGLGAMTFSVSGPSYYPSAAYMLFNTTAPAGSITLSGPGARPEDGFTCYAKEGYGPACRWGDYSAASSDGTNHIVMGNEMVPNTARDPFANWGTFVSTLTR